MQLNFHFRLVFFRDEFISPGIKAKGFSVSLCSSEFLDDNKSWLHEQCQRRLLNHQNQVFVLISALPLPNVLLRHNLFERMRILTLGYRPYIFSF